jgi:hypothetical protein
MEARKQDILPAHPNTCDWFFETPEFLQWRDPACLHLHNGVLWVKGKPGSGKSTLMKHAFLRYESDLFRDHLIAAFFFNAQGGTLEKTPLGMHRSIVFQLLSDAQLYEYLAPTWRNKQRTIGSGQAEWRE